MSIAKQFSARTVGGLMFFRRLAYNSNIIFNYHTDRVFTLRLVCMSAYRRITAYVPQQNGTKNQYETVCLGPVKDRDGQESEDRELVDRSVAWRLNNTKLILNVHNIKEIFKEPGSSQTVFPSR